MSGVLRYDRMVEDALKGVLRAALKIGEKDGLPGDHHFYITFRTGHPGVTVADYLRAQYPNEMTIVIQHQYWGLEVDEQKFAVTLSFNRVNERLVIPFAAVTAFADPSAKFGLQFQGHAAESEQEVPLPDAPASNEGNGGRAGAVQGPRAPAKGSSGPTLVADEGDQADRGQVIALDAFRKK